MEFLSRVRRMLEKPQRLFEVLKARHLTRDWVALTTHYLGIANKYPLEVRLGSVAVRLQTRFDVATFWLIFAAETYPVPRSARTIVDIGGNIGLFTLYGLERVPEARIVTLEPAPDSFERMSRHISQHEGRQRATMLQQAFGGNSGTTRIDLAAPSQFRRTGERGITVELVTLEQIVQQYGPVDYLKIDAEGAEYPGLLNVPENVLRQVGSISLEFHPQESGALSDPKALVKRLTDSGFDLTLYREDGEGYGLAHLVRKDWSELRQIEQSAANRKRSDR